MALNQTLASTRNLSFCTPKNPLTNTQTPSLSSLHFCTYLRPNTKPLRFNRSFKCSVDYTDQQQYSHQVAHPKPQEIQWRKELANSVQLIGTVGTTVEIRHLPSGKALAWTRLAVKKSATDTTWINLTFWDELANVAFQHVEKGHQIYVSGRLISDTVENDEGKQQTYYKVVVQHLNFVEKSSSSVPSYDRDSTAGRKFSNNGTNNSGSTEELWQAFFANPVDWWDNRKNKRNPKYPDFKHKDTGEALWVEGRYNPPWVKSQLAILDTRMGSLHDQDSRMHANSSAGDDFIPF